MLGALAALGQELAGLWHPSDVAERVCNALVRLLRPSSLLMVLTDAADHTQRVACAHNIANPTADDPLVELALRVGPRAVPRDVGTFARAAGVSVERPPASWLGAPVRAGDRSIGAVSASSDSPGRYGPGERDVLTAVLAQATIALEAARLLEPLSEGKHEWEQTVDAIGEAFCVIDAAGTVRRANRAFGLLVQRPLTTLAGRPWRTLLPEAGAEAVARSLTGPAAEGYEVSTGKRLYRVSALPLGDPADRSAVLVFADQTDKKRLQEQLIQSEKMSAIGQLIAGVAHDLNNPLASVVGFADYLVESEKNAPPQLLEPLRAIQQEAERAANIVRNLLSFARKQERRRRSQRIGPILEATLLLLRNQLMACKVEGHATFEPDLPEATLDANQIQQVFVNLINNAAQAIQASGTGGNVWVRAARWLDGVAVTVEDDGPGIPEPIADRVFEPFFTTKAEGQGTGLGLSICHGIVKEHGGRITLGKREGGGASFRVELPGGTPVGDQPVPAAPAATGTLRVLVVDDEPHILHYMHATLEAWGHSVVIAGDGADALARARAAPFDVIITDLRMPQAGGREFFETLRQERPDLAARVVFSTGDTVRGDTLAFLESLGRPYLKKPFSLAELKAALGAAVEAGRG